MDDKHITNKKYSVVQFISDSTYSEVPTTWLVKKGNKQLCWWPPRKANAAILIANCSSPDIESWNQYEVHIIKFCSSLENARKSAANADYQTTDEEQLGRGKRFHVSNSRFDDNSDDRDSEDDELRELQISKIKSKRRKGRIVVSAMPLCPENFHINVNEYHDIESNNSEEDNNALSLQAQNNKSRNSQFSASFNLHEMQIVFRDNQPMIGENNNVDETESNLTTKNYLKQILQMQTSTKLMLQDIKKHINYIQNTLRSHAFPSTNNNYTLIAQFLPLDTLKNIKKFELLMRNTEEAVVQFKQYLLEIGGNNPKYSIRRTLPKIFTNNCAINCSWKGYGNHFGVCNLYCIKIMREEIASQHTDFTETQFNNIVAKWFSNANQRKLYNDKAKSISIKTTKRLAKGSQCQSNRRTWKFLTRAALNATSVETNKVDKSIILNKFLPVIKLDKIDTLLFSASSPLSELSIPPPEYSPISSLKSFALTQSNLTELPSTSSAPILIIKDLPPSSPQSLQEPDQSLESETIQTIYKITETLPKLQSRLLSGLESILELNNQAENFTEAPTSPEY